MDEPSPTNAAKFAALAVTITRNVKGIELDYSPSSLEQVDAMICEFRAEGHTAETMNESMILLGCYLGEVMIRNRSWQWKLAGETGFAKIAPPDFLVVETADKSVWNPIDKVFKLLENGM